MTVETNNDSTEVTQSETPEAADGVEAAQALDPDSQVILDDLQGDSANKGNLDLLLDVNLKITVELGRAQLKFRDVLNLSNGSIVQLGRMTSEPVDILVNGALLATGEVVVMDDHFAIRITKLLNRVERLKRVI